MRYFKASFYFLNFVIFLIYSSALNAGSLINSEPLSTKNFSLHFYNQSRSLDINKIHRWVIELKDSDGKIVENAKFSLEGGMPEHDHGLPTEPRVTRYLGDGKYQLEGLKFHMSGLWQLDIVIEANGHRDKVQFSFIIET